MPMATGNSIAPNSSNSPSRDQHDHSPEALRDQADRVDRDGQEMLNAQADPAMIVHPNAPAAPTANNTCGSPQQQSLNQLSTAALFTSREQGQTAEKNAAAIAGPATYITSTTSIPSSDKPVCTARAIRSQNTSRLLRSSGVSAFCTEQRSKKPLNASAVSNNHAVSRCGR
ncbi:MAG: hypothetical protein RL215_1264 [Planctomycetota bacterium]